MPRVLVSRFSDCALLAPRLREADIQELKACGTVPLEALQRGFLGSQHCYTAMYDEPDDTPICMFGVGEFPQEPGVGIIWLLGSDDIPKITKTFLRESRRYISMFQDKYTVLTNCVDARNTVHIHWLKWLGFKAIKLHTDYGPEHRPFYEFIRIPT